MDFEQFIYKGEHGDEWRAHQEKAMNGMWATVICRVLDDAIAEEKKFGSGKSNIARWARSKDGRTVVELAGLEWSERLVTGFIDFVGRGERTSKDLRRGKGMANSKPE